MSKNKNINPDEAIKDYREADSPSLRGMNFGLWLSENQRYFWRALVIGLITVSAFFFIYSGYNYYLYLSDNSDANTENLVLSSPRSLTNDLEISALLVFSSGDNYDLAVKIKNPNEKFTADLNYCFKQAATEIICDRAFILPSQEKYILALGQKISGDIDELAFFAEKTSWQRINSKEIKDWNIFYSSRLNFVFSNLKFSPAAESGLSERINLNSLEFKAQNQTSYAYYEAPLDILLFSGSELVGVNRYLLTSFLAGESRDVKLSWPGELRSVNRVEIQPNINIIDEKVYLKYQGQGKK